MHICSVNKYDLKHIQEQISTTKWAQSTCHGSINCWMPMEESIQNLTVIMSWVWLFWQHLKLLTTLSLALFFFLDFVMLFFPKCHASSLSTFAWLLLPALLTLRKQSDSVIESLLWQQQWITGTAISITV